MKGKENSNNFNKFYNVNANEGTPLLVVPSIGNGKKLWSQLRASTAIGFTKRRPSGLVSNDRKSTRLTVDDLFRDHGVLEPADALAPLVKGGVVVTTSGYRTSPRPPSTVKSLPTYAPFIRTKRHRSFTLWWINEFRHWWKSSRLLVRLAGLWTLAISVEYLTKMENIAPYRKHHKADVKNTEKALKVVKHLGRGGPMRWFLQTVQPFTRTLRILVAAWRWIEAAQCRRLEVGVEEAMAFTGNRVSRILSRSAVDLLVVYGVMPTAEWLFRNWLPDDYWHPVWVFVILAILRACSPYAASFQGSRAGRVLTREFFKSLKLRWQPVMRVQHLNLESDDCCERDEISENADLAKVAKKVAKALGISQRIGLDGMTGQAAALAEEGFYQVGAGSGGYAVYICQRRVWTQETGEEGADTPILLHITPYGPSILDVMPRYVVLEFETSIDRREKWSEYLSRRFYDGPPVLEGYCYEGAFFSPHHFAQLKNRYDKQLLTYDKACRTMCKPRTGRKPNPPTDLLSLKTFLADGKMPRKRRRNERERNAFQGKIHALAHQIKSMQAKDKAPRGIILYFEGLDCSGKSSTGGLVQQVLEEAGYQVRMCQYNRPPTAEQKLRPWMDRFETPETSMVFAVPEGTDIIDQDDVMIKCQGIHEALVWDRGPAGDFVYGELAKAPDDDRKDRFREFMDFDREMFEKGILFCKLLFVTNRDSIASTLGKRLAQRHMAKDLRTWLQASRGGDSTFGDIGFEGLEEINLHIDPTDFVAFNRYQKNLRVFTNFALNTDSNENPWLVVNTTDRTAARKQLLRAFAGQLKRFEARQRNATPCCTLQHGGRYNQRNDTPGLTVAEVENGFVRPYPISGLIAWAGLFFLMYWYAEHTTFGKNLDTFVSWYNEGSKADLVNRFLLEILEI
mmetsp:Transcript_5810/g.11854  ORF Transcript_5810/g.11854 Transcript_5810/m.11854 type:complete len:907 (+) Transcript_5810:57-2777(+)